MPQVSVIINGRSYPVACDEGEEGRIRDLARMIDTRVANFARQVGQAGEARLLVLAALVLADELSEANEAAQRLGGAPPGPDNTAVAGNVSRLAQRIEAVAARLETSHI
ncbi:MAG TPA: cell division protein ZapA [Stellaceae bacterium]|jgi:cell division protein ZapA|nr:cell division protein ZapA [Stellaceae bacterium]